MSKRVLCPPKVSCFNAAVDTNHRIYLEFGVNGYIESTVLVSIFQFYCYYVLILRVDHFFRRFCCFVLDFLYLCMLLFRVWSSVVNKLMSIRRFKPFRTTMNSTPPSFLSLLVACVLIRPSVENVSKRNDLTAGFLSFFFIYPIGLW